MFKTVLLALDAVPSTETSAVQVESSLKAQTRAKIDAEIENYLNAETGSDAEWGFLKNIVNIDKFFDSGVKA